MNMQKMAGKFGWRADTCACAGGRVWLANKASKHLRYVHVRIYLGTAPIIRLIGGPEQGEAVPVDPSTPESTFTGVCRCLSSEKFRNSTEILHGPVKMYGSESGSPSSGKFTGETLQVGTVFSPHKFTGNHGR